MDVNKLLLNNPENSKLKEKLVNMNKDLNNPFIDLYHWVKGEIYDLAAIQAAINLLAARAKKIQEL